MLNHRPALELPELSVRQLVTGTLVVGLVALAVWLLFRFNQILLILLAGIIISTALRPAVTWLRQRGLSAAVSVLILFAVMLVVLGLFLRFVAPLIADQTANIGAQLQSAYTGFVRSLADAPNLLLRRIAEALPAQPGLPANAAPADGAAVAPAASPFEQLWRYVTTIASGTYKAVAIFFVAFFWTLEAERIKRSGILLLPVHRREGARALIGEMEQRVGSYVVGQLLLSLIIGTLSLIAYLIIGLPSALVLALFVAIMEVIPLVGPLIGAIPSILVALSISPTTALWVMLASLIIHQLESNVFGPRVMKRTLNMRPLVTLLALTAFGSLFGILGALVALPLAAVIQLLLDRSLLSVSPATETTGERDQIGLLRYQTQELVEDVRKVLRNKEPDGTADAEHLEDDIEAIARDLDLLLGQYRTGAEAA
jgi:predicted PurR-regulated permease PerM